MTVCWARLILKGTDYGIHAFLIHLRDSRGDVLPGVSVKDCGHKMGVNGVDNGRFWFRNVRVPKTALLNKFADVTDSADYISPVKDSDARFGLHMSWSPSIFFSDMIGADVFCACLEKACSLTGASIFADSQRRHPSWVSQQPFVMPSPGGSLDLLAGRRCRS